MMASAIPTAAARPVRSFGVQDLPLNRPLPMSIYDGSGHLLLRKGALIRSQEQMLRLLERGAYTAEEQPQDDDASQASRHKSVYQAINGATLRLKTLLNDFRSPDPSANLVEQVQQLGLDLIRWTSEDEDAAIAAAHLDYHNLYLLAHQTHAAVLVALVAPRLELSVIETLSLICAALTHDLGMMDFIELERQPDALADEQRHHLLSHPERSVHYLKRAGVTDTLWLEAVAGHHERPGGDGYPRGLAGDAIHPLAQVFSMIDAYMAMIKPRAWRKARPPIEALKQLSPMAQTPLLTRTHAALVQVLGLFPPGSFVRLANKEIAIVSRRTADLRRPVVFSLYESNTLPRMQPLRRALDQPEYQITQAVAHTDCKLSFQAISRLWTGG